MAANPIPAWIYSCLDQYANCACGRNIVKKLGKDELLSILDKEGYPCDLEILADPKDTSQYPKDGTYILTLKNSRASRRRTQNLKGEKANEAEEAEESVEAEDKE